MGKKKGIMGLIDEEANKILYISLLTNWREIYCSKSIVCEKLKVIGIPESKKCTFPLKRRMEYVVAGFVAEKVLGELLKSVKEAMKKKKKLETTLKSMESKLNSIIPVVKSINELNIKLDREDEDMGRLWKQIKEGQKLVRECSKGSRCRACFKKPNCTEELRDLDNSLKTFYDFVLPLKEAKILIETREDVQEILDKAKRIDEKVELTHGEVKGIHKELQSRKSPASLPLYLPPDPPAIVVGLDKPLKDLKTELVKNGFSVVLITAPGGYGKTTLAKKLCHEEDIKGKYKDNIFFITVSKRPNLKVIVQNLYLRMGYSHVPEFQSDDDAVNNLEQLLKLTTPNPILLVLDDVWPESEFLIDKLKFQIPDYKILVTSTCVFSRFTSTHKLQPLNDVNATVLFTSSAILPHLSSYIPDESILNKIVKACKGNPLALTVVGRSLCGQPAVVWQNTVMELSKGGSIVESNATLRDCLQQSLEVLDNKVNVKECYMDLVSFPEGQWIPATALIDMWVELYDPDEDGVNSVAMLHHLDALNLVNHEVGRKDNGEIDGYYNNHHVMQHDLLRQHVNDQISSEPVEQRKRLIIDISGNKLPKWWREQRKQHLSACLLSITTDETFSLKWSNMQAPEVEVLILNVRSNNYMLPEFVKKMDKLKALLITNYGFVPAEISNFPLLSSLLDLKRIRLEKVSIASLSLSSLELKKLQKISLVMCNIGQSFTNSRIQISSSFSNLSEISIDCCIDLKNLPDWFCDLVHLKKLSISSCWELSELPKEIGKLVNLEVLTLHFCIQLVELPKAIGNLSKLSILDISDCANISRLPEQIGGLRNLRKLYMKGCSISELPLSVMDLKRLEIVMCDDEAAILWTSFIQELPNLKIKAR
ncbi:unnamed protein product [Dovyalis caffra]|uniref:RPW8 domain-containing protein n=1 Tax=Dovyalis caffra TaxID=77055 RepID=A0AAV1RSY2_9ROSI|nr:unnamed protein product [Dovyalis caffra]